MDSDFDNSRIEKLKSRLYSQNNDKQVLDSTKGATLEQDAMEVPESQWGETKLPDRPEMERAYHRSNASRFFKTLFIISAAFCVIAAGIAAFIFIGKYNRITTVDISVVGPVSIAGGEKLILQVGVNNKNGVDMVDAHVRIDYPSGSYSSTNTALMLPRDERGLDTIKAGSQKQTSFEAVLFGEENTEKDFTITVEYKLPGSTSLYSSNKKYTILLTKAPISLLVNYEKAVTTGQKSKITLTAISNSSARVENVLLKALYPLGWVFESAEPATVGGTQDTWQLGSFNPGEQKTIDISGTIKGQQGEEKVFRFSLGSPEENDENKISTSFVDAIATMALQQAFITTKIEAGKENKNGEVVATLGDIVVGSMSIKNNTSRDLVDVVIEMKPEGQIYDRYTINTPDGFYKSTENTIYWDKVIKPSLKILPAGEEATVQFVFKTYTADKLVNLLRNPQMSLNTVVTAKSITDVEGTKVIKVPVTKVMKFSTNVALDGKTMYSTGPFANGGPIPLRAEQATSFTLGFEVKNSFNQVSNAKLTAVLPFYVQWAQQPASSTDKITFDSKTRTVTWDVGELLAGTGYAGPVRKAAFQVYITPSTSQIGQTPPLATDIKLIGVDRFTGDMIQMSLGTLNTKAVDQETGSVKP